MPFLALAIVVGALFWFWFDLYPRGAWQKQGQFDGTTVGLAPDTSKGGINRPSRLVAELENGIFATLHGSEGMLFEKGRPVIVELRISEENKRERYVFVAYLDSE